MTFERMLATVVAEVGPPTEDACSATYVLDSASWHVGDDDRFVRVEGSTRQSAGYFVTMRDGDYSVSKVVRDGRLVVEWVSWMLARLRKGRAS